MGRVLGLLPSLAAGLLVEAEQLAALLALYVAFRLLDAHLLKPRLMAQ